ncbi:MAG: hypothetical protein A4E28_00478 [Methanocella sp. PtaU1.Bin125]|nr:MAG: hypothetical protein A4E28_00478 [Methanocella sp. PtaU1.Bin125]
MDAEAPRYSAIAGCGPSGCMITSLLKQSSAKARLIAVDESDEALRESGADVRIKARPGEKVAADIAAFEIVFIVFDPTEPGAAACAGEVASRVAAEGAFSFGIVIRPPGQASPDLTVLRRPYGSIGVIDADYILGKRGGKDPAMALQIAFNFTAHTLTFLAGAIDAGDLSAADLKSAASGRIVNFAASHVSDPIAIYSMAFSKIDRAAVKSGIVFLDDAIEDVPARRIFLGIGRTLPGAGLDMIRTKGLEPFKILAILAQ